MNTNFESNTFNYALYRNTAKTNDVSVYGLYERVRPEDMANAFKSQSNVDFLISEILALGKGAFTYKDIYIKVNKLVEAWVRLGKFDKVPQSVSITTLVDTYNKVFIDTFYEDIFKTNVIPSNLHQQPSSLNGMPAQQTRFLDLTPSIKNTPFWEKALYKRNHDKKFESSVNDTEGLFYVQDTDNMTDGIHNYAKDINTYQSTSFNDDEMIERLVPQWSLMNK